MDARLVAAVAGAALVAAASPARAQGSASGPSERQGSTAAVLAPSGLADTSLRLRLHPDFAASSVLDRLEDHRGALAGVGLASGHAAVRTPWSLAPDQTSAELRRARRWEIGGWTTAGIGLAILLAGLVMTVVPVEEDCVPDEDGGEFCSDDPFEDIGLEIIGIPFMVLGGVATVVGMPIGIIGTVRHQRLESGREPGNGASR